MMKVCFFLVLSEVACEHNLRSGAETENSDNFRKALRARIAGYAKEYIRNEKTEKFLMDEANKNGHLYRRPEAKLMFVIRECGYKGIQPKQQKILELFRLHRRYDGVFMRITKATLGMLKRISHLVNYGVPTLKVVQDMLYWRGFGYDLEGRRQRLADDGMITDSLGKFGIHGIEDVIHEIWTVGPAFKMVNQFLAPIKTTGKKDPCWWQPNLAKGHLLVQNIYDGANAGRRVHRTGIEGR